MSHGPKIQMGRGEEFLPRQVVEDEDGNMAVVDEAQLLREARDGEELFSENDLALENMENDLPCSDVMDDGMPDTSE